LGFGAGLGAGAAAPLSDAVLLDVFVLSGIRGESAADKAREAARRAAAAAAGLVALPPSALAAPLAAGADAARAFAHALTNEQSVRLLRHGSGPGGGGGGAAAGGGAARASAAVDAAPDARVLAGLWGGAFDRLFAHVVLNLPRLVAEASLACAAAVAPGAPAPLPLPLSLAVGGPLLASLQDMLTDVDVLTLVREAVAARVQARLLAGGAAPAGAQAAPAAPVGGAAAQAQAATGGAEAAGGAAAQ